MSDGESKMAGKGEKGKSISITISQAAYEELSALCEWKGIALGLHLRQVVEAHHENPGTQKIISKAVVDLKSKRRK